MKKEKQPKALVKEEDIKNGMRLICTIYNKWVIIDVVSKERGKLWKQSVGTIVFLGRVYNTNISHLTALRNTDRLMRIDYNSCVIYEYDKRLQIINYL